MRKTGLSIVVLFISITVFSQDTVRFSSGLAVSSGSRYGRDAIYTDMLAWKMYNGSLGKPAADKQFNINEKGDTAFWKEVKADSAGWFRIFPGEIFNVQSIHF